VIVDTLHKLVKVQDSSAYAEISNAMTPLVNLARETSCHIHILHHTRKGSRMDARRCSARRRSSAQWTCSWTGEVRHGQRITNLGSRSGVSALDQRLHFDPVTERVTIADDSRVSRERAALSTSWPCWSNRQG